MAIGLMIALWPGFMSHSPVGLAQIPEPDAPQPADAEGVPSEPDGTETAEPGGVEPDTAEPGIPESGTTEPTEPGVAEPAVPEGYQRVTGDGWSFAVPPGWQNLLSEPVELGEDTLLAAQMIDSQKQTVVNLVIQDYKGDNNDYIDQSVKILSDLGTVHTQELTTISGWQATALDFSLTAAEPPTRLLQRVIAANGTGFALTCGGREENFSANQPVCTTILNSFQISPP
jgi:hypothetical protein